MKKTKLTSLIVSIVAMITCFTMSACSKTTVTGIAFDENAVKSTYSVGETVKNEDVKLVVSMSDETSKTITLDTEGVVTNGIDTTSAGSKKLTVSYEGQTLEHNYTVVAVYQGLAFKNNTYKAVYDYNETIDYSQIKIIASYNDETTQELALTDTGVTYTAINTLTVGKQTLTATYDGKTASVEVEVKAVLTGIELTLGKTGLAFNEEVDLDSINNYITANYNDGTTKKIYLNTQGVTIVDDIDSASATTQTFTVSYEGFEDSVDVTVQAKIVASVEIVETTLKSQYLIGTDDFNPAEIEIKVTHNDIDETVETIKLSDVNESDWTVNLTSQGNHTLSVTYGGVTGTATINVVAQLLEVKFKDGTPTTFGYNQDVDYSKLILCVIYNDPALNTEVALSTLENDAFNSRISKNTLGAQTLSVTYLEKTVELNVQVVALVTGIEIKQNAYELKLNPTASSGFDYSQIKITVYYNDTTSIEIPITDANHVQFIEHSNNIDITKEALDTVFSVQYTDNFTKQSFTDTCTVNVRNVITAASIALPEYYEVYKTNSNSTNCGTDVNKFEIANKPYLVGTVNKFKFEPEVLAVDLVNVDQYNISNPKTTFKLYVDKTGTGDYEEVNPTEFIEDYAQDNMYNFRDTAIDNYFKIEVSLDSNVYDVSHLGENNVITAYFKVVYGYNAYDTYGLSVMDNLNVKNWAKIKNRILPYDDKYLYEYTDVTEIILHNDIVINADQLPANYFWNKNTPGFAQAEASLATAGTNKYNGLLEGSLRDGFGPGNATYTHCSSDEYGTEGATVNKYDLDGEDGIEADEDFTETYGSTSTQKGIFNTDQCSITGNYMKISVENSATRRLESVLSRKHNAGGNPTGHWSLFKFYKHPEATEEVNIHFQDVFITGNMGKAKTWNYPDNPEATPSGLMAGHMTPDKFTVDNIVLNQFYVHFIVDESANASNILDFKNSHLSDAYSNMLFLWRSKVNITNSILENAGGPIFVCVDGSRLKSEAPTDDNVNKLKETFTKYGINVDVDKDSCGPTIIVDSKSKIESIVTAKSTWFVENGADSAVGMISGLNILLSTNSEIKKSFMNSDTIDTMNFIGVIVPSTEKIFESNLDLEIFGKITRINENGTTETYQMNDSMSTLVKTMNSVGFVSNGQYAFMKNATTIQSYQGKAMTDAYLQSLDQPAPALATMFNCPEAGSNFANSSDWLGVLFRGNMKDTPYIMAVFGDFKSVA